jgi:amino acid transporter
VQGLTGWEAAIPLAEETSNPRRNIPWAIIGSILVLGALLVVAYWGQLVGWGVNDIGGLVKSGPLPAFVIGQRVWGDAWPITMFAAFTSTIAASIACQNVATRMWYGMARQGALPSVVAKIHPTRKTPVVAIVIQLAMGLLMGLLVPALIGPDVNWFLVSGFLLVLAVILVYALSNLGVILYFWRERRSEFNWFFHFALPFATTGVLAYALVEAFTPFPAYPYNWSPAIVGGWMLIGLGILVWLRRTGRNDWIAKAGAIVEERLESEPMQLERQPVL